MEKAEPKDFDIVFCSTPFMQAAMWFITLGRWSFGGHRVQREDTVIQLQVRSRCKRYASAKRATQSKFSTVLIIHPAKEESKAAQNLARRVYLYICALGKTEPGGQDALDSGRGPCQ